MVAKKLDRRLAAVGAGPVVERGLGDDQHPSGYEAVLDPWLASLWTALRRLQPLAPGLSEVRAAFDRPLHAHQLLMANACVLAAI